ncbi:UDP-N-acetylmuramate--L-alanine ligase [Spirochaetia bacterium]|nr:UDP-N-acetylmuramate--L-alanine ligase [Spirochaetia bacterium]
MELLEAIKNKAKIYMIGIKGTGMCAFAELLHTGGAKICGSDTSDVFYTDAILTNLHIPYTEGFCANNIPQDAEIVIHSAAYEAVTNVEVAEAKKRNLPLLKYTEALGEYSRLFYSTGICGVHGKTTTTAMAGTLLKALALPVKVLAGSAVGTFAGKETDARSTLNMGNKYFVAETCEYKKHFLSFYPSVIVLTSVESDHQDFFPTYNDIRDAFVEYAQKLPANGKLIYCADDAGAREVAALIKQERPGITFIEYGFKAAGAYKITNYDVDNEKISFNLEGFPVLWTLSVPGKHNALNAAAAFALTHTIMRQEGTDTTPQVLQKAAFALGEFYGSKRRCEIIGRAGGILFIDDYGHHPTAIKTTLAGIKEYYPNRRIIVSFMSHTYTRTAALLDEFAAAFESAGMVILHKIYASAREVYSGGITGRTLFEETKQKHDCVFYCEEPLDAAELLKETLRENDLFISMGAGDNWKLCRALFDYYKKSEKNKG